MNLNEAVELSHRELTTYLIDETAERSAWGLQTPEKVRLKVVIANPRFGGQISSDSIGDYIAVNALSSVTSDQEIGRKYAGQIRSIEQWFEKAHPLLNALGRDGLEEALEVLTNPVLLDSLSLDLYPGEMRLSLLEDVSFLESNSTRIYKTIEEVVSQNIHSGVSISKSHVRHELEHLNPLYRPVIRQIIADGVGQHTAFKQFAEGVTQSEGERIIKMAYSLIERTIEHYPFDEARAHLWQAFDPKHDNPQALKAKRRHYESKIISQYAKRIHLEFIGYHLSTIYFTQEIMKGNEKPIDTFAAAENIINQTTGAGQPMQYNDTKVNVALRDAIVNDFHFYMSRLTESTTKAFDRAERYFQERMINRNN